MVILFKMIESIDMTLCVISFLVPITLIQLDHLSVMAAYVVLHIGLVNMGLQTVQSQFVLKSIRT